MKIVELLKKINERFPTSSDKNRAIDQLFNKSNELHVCDLDLALIFIAASFQFRNVDARAFFVEREELFNALIDSSYVRYFAPELFASDIVTVDDKQRQKEIEEAVLLNLTVWRIGNGGLEAINNHELLKEIDVATLNISKSNKVNYSNKVQIQIRGNNVYSFALSQTKFNIINDIILTNITDEEIKDAKLVISADPGLIEFSDIDVPLLNPHQPISISEFDVKPNLEELINLAEKTICTITAKLVSGEEELVSITQTIEYYSFDTWFENVMDGSSALFVTPNDVAVKNVISLVGQELQKTTGSPSIDGYQSGDKNSVVAQIKALYNVLFAQGIAYINPPASFEEIGQKIRLPHDVLVHKQGTCLDLTLLFVSCAESMGLNPFIVLKSGHAFAGVFLEETKMPTTIFYDAPRVLEMNSEEENEVVFVECTSFVAGSNESFEESCVSGRQNVLSSITNPNTGKADPCFKVVDIQRARTNGFLPLPINFDDVDRIIVDYDVLEQNKIRLARKSYNYKGEKIELSEAELNKFDVWEKKLLDLSKRNQLINYKTNGRGLQLFYYDLNDLYEAFKECGKPYTIGPVGGTENMVFELPEATEDVYKELKEDFDKQRIGLIFRSQAQTTSLKFFERERRKSFEETGSNIFYLAIGFIRYFENEKTIVPFYAPIVLVPIDLIKHSKDNYSIRGREEPPFLNISAFEFFHQEYGMNFDDLLTLDLFDDEEISIDSILNTVSEKIKKLKRASIVRTAAINIFNFSKAVMWSDVKFRKEELSKNKVIKSIINKKFAFEDGDEIDDAFDDDNSNPADLAIPLPADSSQIIAIKDCAKGKSFILQGPPGTGKSQTITNMIVNAIYHGKTVLFVAEKMAALDVVRKRLNQLCLGRFALEAHSTKADKASLMEQFGERVALSHTIASKEEYLKTADQIKEERTELNRVINLLHKENGYFLSFYDSFVNYLCLDEDIQVVNVDDKYVSSLYELEFKDASALCGRLYSQIVSNGGYLNNPFLLYRNDGYVPGFTKRQLQLELEEYIKLIGSFIETFELFKANNGIDIPLLKEKMDLLVGILRNEEILENALLHIIEIDFDSIDRSISTLCENGISFQKNVSNIRSYYSDSVFDLDSKQLLEQYNSLQKAFFIKKAIGVSKLVKTINSYSKGNKKCSKSELPILLNSLISLKEQEDSLREQMKKMQIVFGGFNIQTTKDYDFADFNEKYVFTKELVNHCGDAIGLTNLKTLVFKMQSYSLQKRNELLKAFDELDAKEKNLVNEFKFDFSYREKRKLTYADIRVMSERMLSRIDYLPSWCALLTALDECKEHNISFVVDLIEKQEIINDDLELIYKKSIFSHIITKSIMGDENGSFNSVELKNHVNYYRQLIERFKELTIKETAARVSARMPSIKDDSPASSQQGILNKAIKNRCRGKAIRQLFAEVPDILTKIFPVFLMSPMSCAQYLSADMPKFDIVIFDEASQMPTSEAIGAIARGKSLIVVGDSKQMPPTSFFQSKGSDDLDVDLDDQESILDDCDVIGMPSRRLNWHYRSKHESLIRFSNAKFYGNNLVTFPSPNDMSTKVSFINTKGIYGGKKATNEIEAKAIIKEVERRLKSPDLRQKSIGIVTFSSVQQEMIDDLLQDFFAKNKDLEKINIESKEPIIVKNLENIQGDERDVILFSVCYGPDKSGNMYYRFGPINNQGGEKRLNVAISRARYEMIIFASFEPERLANMKTESVGAKELYNFLRYAKDGADALVLPNGNAIESRVGFEKQIAEKLEERGYQVNVDVGKSSFRVDVGVVHPDKKNEYILGILCDSYSYQSALTARDRNIVQPTALELLGWNLVRVWSFDYLDNPKQIIDDICDLIEDIRLHPESYRQSVEENPQMEIEFESEDVKLLNFSKPYKQFNKVYRIYGTESDNPYVHRQIIKEIMEMEAPVSKDVLQNRFANAIGVKKAGTQIQSDMLNALRSLGAKKNTCYNDKDKIFFWLDGQSQNLEYYRVGGEKQRSMYDVPKEEIFVAVKEVLLNHGPMFKSELKSYVARAFDIKAVGNLVNKAIDGCVDYFVFKGELAIVDDGSRVALKSQEK